MRGPETERSHEDRIKSGFYEQYLQGEGFDVGYGGSRFEPVLPQAIGLDRDTPGYDGSRLPAEDNSKDFVFSSHCLEHISNWGETLREWFRVIKVGGFLITIVPHKYLYEKKWNPPSNWNRDHKRFYTPMSLMHEIEYSLDPNSYRVRELYDNDKDFNYDIMPDKHSHGSYEIVCVLQKIEKPKWKLLK